MSDDEQLLFGDEFQAQLAQMQAETAAAIAAQPPEPGLFDTIVEALTPPHEPTLGEVIANEVRLNSGPDTDRDGRTDLREREEGSNPTRDERDLDMDGLDNTAEAAAGTSPHQYDSDWDGMADGLEAVAGRDPNFPDGDEEGTPGFYERLLADNFDADRDGLLDEVETSLGTSPTNANTDGDRLSDGLEVGSWSADMRMDPLSPDTDGDGRIDGFDRDNSRDEADDDFDGLDNTLEKDMGTSPHRYDTDGDGATDGLELSRDTNPIVFDEISDDDFDANLAIESMQRFDRDQDGLVDRVERALSTDPDDPDSDDDALTDGIDDEPLTAMEGMEGLGADPAPLTADFDTAAPVFEPEPLPEPEPEPEPDSFGDDLDAADHALDAAGDVFDGI